MKDFHAWLSDLTSDLRSDVEPPKPEPKANPNIDPNSIHDALISAIKSVAWRAQKQIPMEDRIEKKVSRLMALYQQIHDLIEQDVNQGSRHQNELTELETRTGSWITELNMAILRHKPGEVPKWHRNDQYVPFHIKH